MPSDRIEVESNLKLRLIDRGKVIRREERTHNIWLNLGRGYMAQLLSYASFGPDTAYRDDRIKYISLGIGGNRQLAIPQANSAPYLVTYPGTNAQTDTDPTVVGLERPVRITGGTTNPPYAPGDVWCGQIAAPPTFPTSTSVTYSRLFTYTDVSYGPYLSVPVAECALYTAAANPNAPNNTPIAYDTFDTLSKTGAFQLEVDWTLRF